MSETLSLMRLFWAGSRTALVVLLTLACVGFLTAQLAIWIAPDDFGRSIGGAILIFTVVPVIVSSVALFNFGDNADIHDIPSGCSHWLLRMPVKSWKIVAVPVLSKTLWITCVWVAFCQGLPRMYVEIDRVPMQAPIFGFSAAAISLLPLTAFFVMTPVAFFYLAALAAGRIGVGTDRGDTLVFRSRDLADAEVATWELVRWLPPIAVALLVAKAFALAVAAPAVVVGNHASRGAVFQICMIWLTIVSSIGVTLSALIPHPAVSTQHCLAFAMLVLPLASVVILPLCLSMNRHR